MRGLPDASYSVVVEGKDAPLGGLHHCFCCMFVLTKILTMLVSTSPIQFSRNLMSPAPSCDCISKWFLKQTQLKTDDTNARVRLSNSPNTHVAWPKGAIKQFQRARNNVYRVDLRVAKHAFIPFIHLTNNNPQQKQQIQTEWFFPLVSAARWIVVVRACGG